MSSVRLNITLPEDVVKTLKQFSGPRGQSSFLAECVRFFVKKKQQAALNKELIEGYQANAAEALKLTAEFEAIDFEGLNED